MFIQKPADIRPSEITDKKIYLKRRRFPARGGHRAAGGVASGLFLPAGVRGRAETVRRAQERLSC